MTVEELVQRLGGRVVQGQVAQVVSGVSAPAYARGSDLVFAQDVASASEAVASGAGVVVLRPGLMSEYPAIKTIVETGHPRLWFARAGKLMRRTAPAQGISTAAVVASGAELGEGISIAPTAVVEEGARIGSGTRIDAGTVVGAGVVIGRDCHVYPRVVLYPGTKLGDRVVVHAGAVLGADGFGYVRDPASGAYTQFPQQGTLLIEDDVEIGANSTIDRGALEETRIRRGTKIDNLVHVGHNCQIGEDVILVALTGVSGSSSVGSGAVLAGQVGIGDHAHVGPGVILGGQAGVLSGKTVTNEGLTPGTVLWGTPARPLKQALREIAVVSRLAKTRSSAAGNSDNR